ncbi:MAG: putative lipid II flippase FtsW [Deltaproteobacteria bacterium]|nr:putative lipid II flippase FtsW [Deltaproteobacteria bacterium]
MINGGYTSRSGTLPFRFKPSFRQIHQRLVMPRLNRPDVVLLLATATLIGLGVVMILNASYFYGQEHYHDPFRFLRKHLAYLGVGLIAAAAISRLRLEWYERATYWILAFSFLSLVLVLIPPIGVVRGGARRWINLGALSFQPAEFAKIALVMYLARSIVRKREHMGEFVRGILPHLVIVGLAVGLILRQPDFGTATILLMLLILMLHAGGARFRQLALLGLAGVPFVIYEIFKAHYRTQRLLCFMDPWDYSQNCGFQLVQSLIAFGSGGISGVGLGDSQQKLFFLPEAHTDFIFALVGEELGLWGVVAVLVLFAIVGIRGFRIAIRHPDPFASLLAFGLTLVIMLEAVINIGVVTGLLPTKGLALPFLSYGGSSLIGTMLQIGMLSALSRMTG